LIGVVVSGEDESFHESTTYTYNNCVHVQRHTEGMGPTRLNINILDFLSIIATITYYDRQF